MANLSNDDRNARKDRISLLLQRSPDGLSAQEISAALNLERRTVHNYLLELETQGSIYTERPLWFIAPYAPIILRKFELSAEEAMVLYLATRLLVKQSDRRNEISETVLLKLAEVLRSDAQVSQDIANAARELASRPFQPDYQDIFRVVMQSYLYKRRMQIIYHPYRSEPFETVICPYLLEPSVIGAATYIIGHSSKVNALRTYKLERVRSAKLLHKQSYEIPPDFPGLELLRNAWSIYHGEETIHVGLRFHPTVARRVRETHWHPSQQLYEDNQDHYVQLHLDIADTTDLKPWIRGWGAHCEVLEPSDLRDEMIGEARRIAETYGWSTHRHPVIASNDDPLGLNTTFNDFFG